MELQKVKEKDRQQRQRYKTKINKCRNIAKVKQQRHKQTDESNVENVRKQRKND